MPDIGKNRMKKRIYFSVMIAAMMLCRFPAWAQTQTLKDIMQENRENREANYAKWGPTSDNKGMGFVVRVGYVLGGTMPLPLPDEIRKINEFSPKGGISVGFDGYKFFNMRWGMTAGLRLFFQGMHTGANVKNYHTAIQMGDDIVEGNFTGTDITDTRMLGLTIPVTAAYRVGARWTFNLGPYFSYWIYRDLDGEVYDGYLRENDPTGQKIAIGSDNPASYDFSDDMRRFSCGAEFCADFRITRHLNVFGLLDWGFMDVFKDDFETISFSLYPIYATFGLAYFY